MFLARGQPEDPKFMNCAVGKTLNKHAHVHGSEKRDLLFLSSRKVKRKSQERFGENANRGHVHVC